MAKITAEARRAARLAEARRLQETLERQYADGRAERIAREAIAAQPLAGVIAAREARVLDGLGLRERRYGIHRPVHAVLLQMGRTHLGDVARLTRRNADNWFGYAQADQLRLRIMAILDEVRSGAPEPGITRIGPALSADDLAWLAGQDLDALAGFGLSPSLIPALRRDGYGDLATLARAESDAIHDVPGFGQTRILRLRLGLAEYVAARPTGRDRTREDAEWDAAAPRKKRHAR